MVLSLALVLAMFFDVKTTDIVKSGYLIILGYFFGQTVSKRTSGKES